MRKDVECTFGILKGRFRILKSGIRLHGVDVADNIWMIYCALHNMLLEKDGLTVNWDGEMGLFDYNEDSEQISFAMRRLKNSSLRKNYDSSGMGPVPIDEANCDEEEVGESYVVDDTPIINDVSTNGINDVHLSTRDFFRTKLVEHFDIQFKKNSVKWPCISNN